jgi:prepilin-type processing-associated H-X9-DG protein
MFDNALANQKKIDLDYVSAGDGTAMTLLLTEKCGTLVGETFPLWNNVVATPTAAAPSTTVNTSAVPVFLHTNASAPSGVTKFINNATYAVNPYPSSNHPGGAVVAFCDGHTGFLKDSLTYPIYAQLMTSNSAESAAPNLDVLSEGAFQ